MIQDLEGQLENIYMNSIEIIYYMRGAISMDQIMDMTTTEKDLTTRWLEKRLDKELKREHPNY